jgi:2-polyprenyl-3-methyl-5-hydroxy-6-metoxy-1,4-benzoquinol methylase
MPVIWDEATYNQAYGLGYTRASHWRNDVVGLAHHKSQLVKLENALPQFNRNNDVLVVGCGYGFLMEVMIDLGATSVWGTDISSYIQTNKTTEARSDVAPLILDINVTDTDAVAQFASAGAGGGGGSAGKFHWVITELVIESYDPVANLAEFTTFLDGLDALVRTGGQTGVAHIFAGVLPDDPHDHSLGLLWMTGAEWTAYRPAHYWIDVHTWQVLGGV